MNNTFKKDNTADQEIGPSPDLSLVGSDTWDCEGMPVSPDMRRHVLCEVAEMLDASLHDHYEWERAEYGFGRFVLTDEVPEHESVGDFLQELTGVRGFLNPFQTHYDALHDFLREYFLAEWGVTVCQMEEEVDADWDGEYTAAYEVMEWISPMRCEDVLAWYERQKKVDEMPTTKEGE